MAGKKKAKIPDWGAVPSQAVADARLGKTDWRVLVALCARRNEKTKLCFPSVERIASDTGIDLANVKKSRTHLKKLGYIDWTREGAGRLSSCRYEIFGLDGKKIRGVDSDLMGVKPTPSNGGGINPPNLKGELKNLNIPKKHSASSKDDDQNNDYQKEEFKTPINIHGKVTAIERRIKEYGVTAIDLDELETLMLEAFALGPKDEESKIRGHAQRVYEDAVFAAPPELYHLLPDWAWNDDE